MSDEQPWLDYQNSNYDQPWLDYAKDKPPAPVVAKPRDPRFTPEALRAHAAAMPPESRTWTQAADDTYNSGVEAVRGLAHGGIQGGLGLAKMAAGGGPMGHAMERMLPGLDRRTFDAPGAVQALADRESANYGRSSGADSTAGRWSSRVGELLPAVVAPELLPEMAGGGLGYRMAEGAVKNALSSQIQAPTANENRGSDAAVNATIGALIPAGGSATRKLLGEVDPLRKAMAARLRSQGINVSGIQEYPGIVGNYLRDTVGAHTGFQTIWSGSKKQAKQFQNRIAEMLGSNAPITDKSVAEATRRRIGTTIGNLHRNAGQIPIDAQFARDVVAAESAHMGGKLATVQDPKLMGIADDLLNLGNTTGTHVPGTFMKTVYSDINKLGHSPGKHELRDAVDSAVKRQLSGPEAQLLDESRAQYRLARAIRNSTGDTAGVAGINAKKALAAVDKASENGPVMPEAHQLLRDFNMAAPLVRKAMPMQPGIMNSIWRVGRGTATGVANRMMENGIIQKGINQNWIRNLTAAQLRALGLEATRNTQDNQE